ncbi:VOC family protein [Parvibaculum sp.]|uniref:VOC family protein n=1 Tax=Parvibaculum sp. TaxID=2024848 RepID=UPI001D8C537D|nr:VOC family protein [Parvibaculum sp.]MBX3490826.1 VOC family protein [Parvibaculum sp.]MCW5728730.1 VOC family protein [Parvibaculum sp.]
MKLPAREITTCLWYDSEAEEAVKFYMSVFKDAKMGRITCYGEEGHDIHGREAGSVMTVEFEIAGRKFVAINGGPVFKFDEAISFQIHCDTQDEIDYFWSKLSEGGEESVCGWLKDKFGLSWQVVPSLLPEMLLDIDTAKSQRVVKAFMQMKKFDIEALKQAYAA